MHFSIAVRFDKAKLALFCSVLLLMATASAVEPPFHTYLTWQGDTSTTITVNFHTEEALENSTVYYDTKSRDGKARHYDLKATGSSHQLDGLRDERYIHVVELTGLEPGETYYFVAGGWTSISRRFATKWREVTEELSFRTIPNDGSPIRFVTGGDMGIGKLARALLARAGEKDPMFGLIGGDLAYVNGDLNEFAKWDRWLRNWSSNMIAPDGRLIPMVLAVGNHEVDGAFGQPLEKARFYISYFAQENRSYFSRKFGKDVVLYALDTGHIASHESQVAWLDEAMTADEAIARKIAVYHVPLYPSVREHTGGNAVLGRTHWVPVFDKHGLTTAFENHDHAHKRTHVLKDNKIDPSGTLYLGDGSFGREPRELNKAELWYMDVANSKAHFWLVEASAESVRYQAIDQHDDVFDSIESR
jgi:hypothetical protein